MRRLLPPLAFLLVLALVGFRTCQRPERADAQARIEAVWDSEEADGIAQVLALLAEYAAKYDAPEDQEFLLRGYLRCRRLDLAVRARWPRLQGVDDRERAAAFARQALRALAWSDEAQSRPGALHAPAMVALLDGGDEASGRLLAKRFEVEPVEALYHFMRQAPWLRSMATRNVLSEVCRRRAEHEPQRPGGDPAWSVAAALLAFGPGPYPERARDLDLLVRVCEGPFRISFRPRWMLACRALGAAADPVGLAALGRVEARLAASVETSDRHDLAVVQLARLAAGEAEGYAAVDKVLGPEDRELRVLLAWTLGILSDRALAGDERAVRIVREVWDGEGAVSPPLRDTLARNVLSEPLGAPRVPWAVTWLEDLELPGAPARLSVHAHAFRLREGAPGAVEALLRWLEAEAGEGALVGADPERAPVPALTALRALHRRD